MPFYDDNDFSFIKEADSAKKKEAVKKVRKADDSDFGGDSFRDASGLLKYNAINMTHSLKDLLTEYGCRGLYASNMYCPFHPDDETGKPSAKYHPDTDILFCFSESKGFTAYHALKLLYGKDMNEVFRESWEQLTESQKESLMQEFGDDAVFDEQSQKNQSLFMQRFELVVTQFRLGKQDIRAHVNALGKIADIVYDEELKAGKRH